MDLAYVVAFVMLALTVWVFLKTTYPSIKAVEFVVIPEPYEEEVQALIMEFNSSVDQPSESNLF